MAGGAMSIDDLDEELFPHGVGLEAIKHKEVVFETAIPEAAQQIMKQRIGQIKSFIWTLFFRYAIDELGVSFEHEDDWLPWFKCWIEANRACGFVQAKKVQWWKEALFIIHREGNEFVATNQDFEDLQASDAGFGKTPEEAVSNLIALQKTKA